MKNFDTAEKQIDTFKVDFLKEYQCCHFCFRM